MLTFGFVFEINVRPISMENGHMADMVTTSLACVIAALVLLAGGILSGLMLANAGACLEGIVR